MICGLTRDVLFTGGWFGLMAMVWFGWAQEDPPRRWRVWLGLGSTVGILMAVGFGVRVAQNWDGATALEGRYPWFGVLVSVEIAAAGIGCWLLARHGQHRWFAWWVALVVSAHFAPLALLLDDPVLIAVAVALMLVMAMLRPRLRRQSGTTSATVGAVMGGVLLALSVVAGAFALF